MSSTISSEESREAGTSAKIIIPSNHKRGHQRISPITLALIIGSILALNLE